MGGVLVGGCPALFVYIFQSITEKDKPSGPPSKKLLDGWGWMIPRGNKQSAGWGPDGMALWRTRSFHPFQCRQARSF